MKPVVRIENHLTEMAITDLLTRQKHDRQGAWPVSLMYFCKKLQTSSPLKTVVRIENEFAEMVVR